MASKVTDVVRRGMRRQALYTSVVVGDKIINVGYVN